MSNPELAPAWYSYAPGVNSKQEVRVEQQIAPELIARAIALVRDVAEWRTQRIGSVVDAPLDRIGNEARVIVAELPAPTDPDLLLAREVAAETPDGISDEQFNQDLRNGREDDSFAVRCALAAIKRVRQQVQDELGQVPSSFLGKP